MVAVPKDFPNPAYPCLSEGWRGAPPAKRQTKCGREGATLPGTVHWGLDLSESGSGYFAIDLVFGAAVRRLEVIGPSVDGGFLPLKYGSWRFAQLD